MGTFKGILKGTFNYIILFAMFYFLKQRHIFFSLN